MRRIPPAVTMGLALAMLVLGQRAGALPPPPGSIDLNSTGADLTVYGDDAGDVSGVSVAAGDIDGDGYDDLIIGAYGADPGGRNGAGETYVVYGAASHPATIDLDSVSAGLTVYGDDASDASGYSVAAGDINGDTADDLIIGAWGAAPGGRVQAGETYVIYGGGSLPPTVDLNSTSAGLTVYGDDAEGRSSWGVGAGDINGDGYDDLIIGAYWASPGGRTRAGETYVIYGGVPGIGLPSVGGSIDLSSASADLTVYGDDLGDNSGLTVAAGDIDGDGYDDLIIGAYGADGSGNALPVAGETYVIYGGGSLPPTIDLNTTRAGLTVYGDDAEDASGWDVAAGDINGDGYDDLIIGAQDADPPGGAFAGETYVIYGGASLPLTIDLNSTSAGLTVYGDDANDTSGWAVATGNIYGDAYDDLIIGAPEADPSGGGLAGETYATYGGASLPLTIDLNSTSADLTVCGDDAGDYSGYSVATGDINGDGYDDLIIGAYSADPAGGSNAGETYLIYGSPACIDRLGDTACDDPVNDPDDDGCVDAEEQAGAPAPKPGSTGAYDPTAWYDFYDVPVPARPDTGPGSGANGTRSKAVTMADVLAVLFYVGASDNGPPNTNGVDYDTIKGVDLNGDTTNDIPPPLHDIEEGVKYDRLPSALPNPPWEVGPPSGAVSMADVLGALAQVGLSCTGPP